MMMWMIRMIRVMMNYDDVDDHGICHCGILPAGVYDDDNDDDDDDDDDEEDADDDDNDVQPVPR